MMTSSMSMKKWTGRMMNLKSDESSVVDKRMLEYGLMKPYADIFCFSTKRYGGYSEGNYSSFNCNGYCGDNPVHVRKHREMLCGLMPERPVRLVIPHQTHQTEVRKIDRYFLDLPADKQEEMLEGVDALVTDLPGYCLCVSTADCVPVLCYDMCHKVVAAIHAGWRGTVSRIVGKTLKVMEEEYGTCGKDVVACIGPSISLQAFEVGDEVYDRFAEADFDMSFIARRWEKWHIDLWEANRLQLLDFGIDPRLIEVAGICTWKHSDEFFSARRQGIASGRILSGIMLLHLDRDVASKYE